MRSVLAVLAGYLIFAVSAVALFQLTGREPHEAASAAFVAATTLYGVFFALVGGYVTANLAPSHKLLHAAIVAAIIVIGAVATLATRPRDAIWSEVSALLLMAPAAALGGTLVRQ